MTGANIGGSHIALLQIIKNLPESINPLIYLDQKGDVAQLLDNEKIPYIISGSNSRIKIPHSKIALFVFLLRNIFKWRRIIRNLDIGLVHLSDDPFPACILPCARLFQIPYVYHHQIKLPKSRLSYFLSRISKNNIFVSQYIKDDLSYINGDVIYNIIELPPNNGSLDEEKYFKIGYFANFFHQKRPFLFIDAICSLIEKGYPVKAYMYGNEAEILKVEIERYIAIRSLSDKIIVSPFVPNVYSIMAQMNVIVSPARSEAFGRVLAEAMALKIPIVAAADAGHCEIITHGHNGWLFPPDNVEDLISMLEILLKNPEILGSTLENGFNYINENFNQKKIMSQILQCYKGS
jgi:glycosyltransferase involved in cell wall biosynthesis